MVADRLVASPRGGREAIESRAWRELSNALKWRRKRGCARVEELVWAEAEVVVAAIARLRLGRVSSVMLSPGRHPKSTYLAPSWLLRRQSQLSRAEKRSLRSSVLQRASFQRGRR